MWNDQQQTRKGRLSRRRLKNTESGQAEAEIGHPALVSSSEPVALLPTAESNLAKGTLPLESLSYASLSWAVFGRDLSTPPSGKLLFLCKLG